jgi:hypothetical protein
VPVPEPVPVPEFQIENSKLKIPPPTHILGLEVTGFFIFISRPCAENRPDTSDRQREFLSGATSDDVSASKSRRACRRVASGKSSEMAPQRDFLSWGGVLLVPGAAAPGTVGRGIR